jgi:hypothetical protein
MSERGEAVQPSPASEAVAYIEKTRTRRVSVSVVELLGARRVSLYEEEYRAGRWGVTRYGFVVDPALVPALIEALQQAVDR